MKKPFKLFMAVIACISFGFSTGVIYMLYLFVPFSEFTPSHITFMLIAWLICGLAAISFVADVITGKVRWHIPYEKKYRFKDEIRLRDIRRYGNNFNHD